jgi:hypothetical protein
MYRLLPTGLMRFGATEENCENVSPGRDFLIAKDEYEERPLICSPSPTKDSGWRLSGPK